MPRDPSTPARVALVTGAAGDIGRSLARRLAVAGWSIAAADHPAAASGLAETVADVASTGGAGIELRFDVVDAEAVEAAVLECTDRLGTPTALVNNAGRQGAFSSVEDYPLADLRDLMAVNVLGVFYVLQTAARAMIGAGLDGAIVNVASMAGVTGAPNMAGYSAAKAAVIGLTRSAAKDLAPHGIRVNAVSPAFIGPGQMWDRQVRLQAEAHSQYYSSDPAEVERQMIGSIPMRRLGSTAEIADVVSFLLSDQSSYLTGQNIEISGGSS